jgi:putative DNA primase/helicase
MTTPAQRIVAALNGKWFGSYGTVCCVSHEDGRPGLKLRDGEKGRLLVSCYAGCEPGRILAELRRRGLLDVEHAAERVRAAGDERRGAEERERRRRTDCALAIWRGARAARGSIVEVYLRTRAISLEVPPTIKFHPSLKHAPTGLVLTAMVAAVQASDRRIVGVHRTFLRADGRDKAPVSEAKLTLGPVSGGAVRLAAAAAEIAVAEGIETALSFMQATGIPTWAALSTSGMQAIVLPPPPTATTVYLAVDVDANRAGEIAAEAAARRFDAEGRKVKLARPVVGRDFNDAIRAGRAA